MPEQKSEKKVEYLELIYDLIFVYIIGRSNSLLQNIEGGFLPGDMFFAYLLCTLAVIQIWNYSTFYINVYGRNGVRDHVFICVNMFLLYFLADGTNTQWHDSFYKYAVPWALILVNLGVQHLIEVRNHKTAPWEIKQLQEKAAVILIEAALVGVHILVYTLVRVSIAYMPIAFGIAAMFYLSRRGALVPADFPHLTERAMLYVVFTFGEMIIALAPYFKEGISGNALYFSLMAFLIVVGLFLSYGILYNRILDREMETNGVNFMGLHLFLILALNNISTALEFMREEEVALLPKTIFLSVSFLVYYTFLLLLGRYAKDRCRPDGKLVAGLICGGIAFFILMIVFRENMYVNIALSVLFIFCHFLVVYQKGKALKEGGKHIVNRSK